MLHQVDVNCKIEFSPKARNGDTTPDMKRAALWYVRKLGYHIFPCHTPIFEHQKGYTCTCEHYRHSEKCRETHPRLYLEHGQHCEHPGKHPRGSRIGENGELIVGFPMATDNEAQIIEWWDKYPDANIGWVPGMDGMAVLDADAYKEEFGGTGLAAEEEETPTQISGSGGNHLVFKKHEGATYSNAAGTLPKGVDVRADNGYIILAPSLHKSGKRYQWEFGYGPQEIEAQLLPERIHSILVEATERAGTVRDGNGRTVKMIEFGDVGEAPDTTDLPSYILDLLNTPAPKGKRSERDYYVIRLLVQMGKPDDYIHGVYNHFPVGRQGKYAEAGQGDRYLGRTLAKVREDVPDPTLGTGMPVDQLIRIAREWVASADCIEYLRECGIRRTADTAKVLQGIVLAAADAQAVIFTPGLTRISFFSNVSRETASRQVDKLADAGVIGIEKGDRGFTFSLSFVRHLCVSVTPTDNNKRTVNTVTLTHSIEWQETHLQSDLFTALPYRYGIKRRTMPTALLLSAGPSAMLVWRELLNGQEMTAKELSGVTGLSVDGCKRALRKLAALSLVHVTGTTGTRSTNVYALVPGAEDRAALVTPVATGYGTGVRNEEINTRLRAAHLDKLAAIIEDGTPAERMTPDVERKISKLEHKAEGLRIVADVMVAQLSDMGIKPKKHWRPLVDNRWDKAEQEIEAAAALKAWNDLDGTPKNERARMMLDAGYTAIDINTAVKASHRKLEQPIEDPEDAAEQADAERQYAVFTAELEAQTVAADWRSSYKQVITLGGDTYLVQSGFGAWEHVDSTGKPVVVV